MLRTRWSDRALVWDYLLADRAGRLERLEGRQAVTTRRTFNVTLRVERLEEWAVAGSLLDVSPALSSLFAGPFALTGLFPAGGVGRLPAAVAAPPAPASPPAPATTVPTAVPTVVPPPANRGAAPPADPTGLPAHADEWTRTPFAFLTPADAGTLTPVLPTSTAPRTADEPAFAPLFAPRAANTPVDPLPPPADDPFGGAGPLAQSAAAPTDGQKEPQQYWAEAGVTDTGVAFEPNVGQAGAGSAFLARGRGYALHLAADGATFVLARATGGDGVGDGDGEAQGGRTAIAQHAVRLSLAGANSDAAVSADDLKAARASYYLGEESFPDVARYGAVRFAGVYDGVDAVYRQSPEGLLEYDFEVAAGKAAEAIAVRVDGADGWALAEDGSLRIRTSVGELTHRAPVAYQEDAAKQKTMVPVQFVARGDGTLGFAVGEYDRSRKLVIDPTVDFAAVVGGSGADAGLDAVVDANGNVVLTGWTTSTDLPAALGPAVGQADAYLAKVAPGGSILFTTYLGGALNDYGLGVAADPLGNVYVTGVTDSGAGSGSGSGSGTGSGSARFPVTPGAYKTSQSPSLKDHFVAKVGPTGALIYGTLLDGTSKASAQFSPNPATSRDGGIAVSVSGEVVVTGSTANTTFPTVAAAQGTYGGGTSDAFLVRLDAAGAAAQFATFVGGSGEDRGHGVSMNLQGDAWVAGRTASTNLPTLSPFQAAHAGGTTDGFVARFDAAGVRTFASYDGTAAADEATAVAADLAFGGGAYVGGTSNGSAAVRGVSGAGASLFRTVVGPGDGEAVALDSANGGVWVGGTTTGGLTTVNAAQPTFGGGGTDGFAARLSAAGAVSTATYAGGSGADGVHGIALAADGEAVAVGTTTSSNFPVAHTPANTDAFVLKYMPTPPAPAITAVSVDTGASNTDFVTNDTSLTVSGTAVPGSTVTLYENATSYGTTTATGGGTWSLAVSPPFPDGKHPLTATATVGSAVSARSPVKEATVDTVAPAVTVELPPPPVTTRTPTVGVTVADAGGVADGATATLDVDLNADGLFTGGELGYASGPLVGGKHADVVLPTLPTAGTYAVRASATDLAGNAGTGATSSLTVVSAAGWSMTAAARVEDGFGVVNPHPLDLDRSPGTAQGWSPALVYNSATVTVQPVVQGTVKTPNTGALPASFTVELLWDGVSQGVSSYTVGTGVGQVNAAPGDDILATAAVTAAQTGIGRHAWQLKVTFAGMSTLTSSGSTFTVSQEANHPYGAGWNVSLAERLVGIPAAGAEPAGVLRVYGDGRWDFYADNGAGGYVRPAGDFGTLAAVGGGGWTHTQPSGVVRTYNAAGMMTQVRSYDANEVVSLTYTNVDADGQTDDLNQVTAVDGGVSTFQYTGGRLVGVAAPSGTYAVAQTGTDLMTLTDPAAGGRSFGYDGFHRMVDDVWAGTRRAWAYGAGGAVIAVTAGYSPDQSTTTVQSQWAVGARVSPSNQPASGTTTDPYSKVSAYRHDARGRVLQTVDPYGGKSVWARNADGLVTSFTDEISRTTTYTYNQGEVASVGLPDGKSRSYTFQATPHRVLTATDENSKTTTYTYTAGGRVQTSKDADGVTATFGYTAGGLLQTVKDNAANVISTTTYDAARRPDTVTFVDGTWTQSKYDAAGNVNHARRQDGVVTTFTNDALGRPTQATTGSIVTKASYDAMGRQTSATDGNGVVDTTAFNSRGEVWRVVRAANTAVARVHVTRNDLRGDGVQFTNGVGLVTWTQRDDVGNPFRVTDDPVAGAGEARSATFDKAGQSDKLTDERGFLSKTVFNPRGWLSETYNQLSNKFETKRDGVGRTTQTLDPLSHGTTLTYTDAGRDKTAVDGAGGLLTWSYDTEGRLEYADELAYGGTRRTKYEYDLMSRVVKVTAGYLSGDDYVTKSAYDAPTGRLATVQTPRAGGVWVTTGYGYDAVGRQDLVTDANTNQTKTVYDAAGNVYTVTRGFGTAVAQTTTYGYDGQNRLVSTTDALGHFTRQGYDAEGRLAWSADGLWNFTVNGYDSEGRLWYTKAPDGGTTWRTYDTTDNLVSIKDPVGNVTTFGYDDANRLTTTADPLVNAGKSSKLVTNVYDTANRLTQRTDRLGRITQYGYDSADRLTSETWKDPTGTVTVDTLTFAYNADGRVKTATNGLGSYAYTYDPLGRRETQTEPGGLVITSQYDDAGDRTQVTDNGGLQATAEYDPGHRLTKKSWWSGGGTVSLAREELTYNQRDEVTRVDRYDGTAGGATKVSSTDVAYYANSLVQSLTHRNSAGTALYTYGYGYDNADRVTGETRNGNTQPFGYDANSQLTSTTPQAGAAEAFTYDKNGNRTTAGYTTGTANRVQTDGTWSYTYDDEGNVLTKSKAGSLWTYTYNHRNQMLTAVETDGGSTVLTPQVTYQYDVYGNVLYRTQSGTTLGFTYEISDPSPGVTKSVHTLWATYLPATSTLVHRYLEMGGQLVARTDATAAGERWLLTDRLGSTREVLNDTGGLLSSITYSGFGGLRLETGTAVDSGNVLFTGGWFDRSTGLYQLHWRSYDPGVGQWTSEDPIGFAAGDANLRRYIGNKASNGIDRSGLIDLNVKLPSPGAAIADALPHIKVSPPKKGAGDYKGFADRVYDPSELAYDWLMAGFKLDGAKFPDSRYINPFPGAKNKDGGRIFAHAERLWEKESGKKGWEITPVALYITELRFASPNREPGGNELRAGFAEELGGLNWGPRRDKSPNGPGSPVTWLGVRDPAKKKNDYINLGTFDVSHFILQKGYYVYKATKTGEADQYFALDLSEKMRTGIHAPYDLAFSQAKAKAVADAQKKKLVVGRSIDTPNFDNAAPIYDDGWMDDVLKTKFFEKKPEIIFGVTADEKSLKAKFKGIIIIPSDW